MKHKTLIPVVLLSQLAMSQSITITPGAVAKITTIQSQLSNLEEQKKVKDIIVSTIDLANKLPKTEANKLLHSQYFLSAKKKLGELVNNNINIISKNQSR